MQYKKRVRPPDCGPIFYDTGSEVSAVGDGVMMEEETRQSLAEWAEDLARRGKTPEEMVTFAREQVSDEYADRLERLIRAYRETEISKAPAE